MRVQVRRVSFAVGSKSGGNHDGDLLLRSSASLPKVTRHFQQKIVRSSLPLRVSGAKFGSSIDHHQPRGADASLGVFLRRLEAWHSESYIPERNSLNIFFGQGLGPL